MVINILRNNFTKAWLSTMYRYFLEYRSIGFAEMYRRHIFLHVHSRIFKTDFQKYCIMLYYKNKINMVIDASYIFTRHILTNIKLKNK